MPRDRSCEGESTHGIRKLSLKTQIGFVDDTHLLQLLNAAFVAKRGHRQ